MVATLYDTKLYGGMYDGTSPTVPTATDDSSEGFYTGFRLLVKLDGRTYVCTDDSVGSATWGIDSKNDELIEDSLHGLSELLIKYCNNLFLKSETDYFQSNNILYDVSTFEDLSGLGVDFNKIFFSGDSILIVGSRRNNGFYSVSSIDSDTELTIEGTFDFQDVDQKDQTIIVISWPKGLKRIGARMADYDVFHRSESPGLASENTGTYSFSKEDTDILGTGYPNSVMAGISQYKRPRIAGFGGPLAMFGETL